MNKPKTIIEVLERYMILQGYKYLKNYNAQCQCDLKNLMDSCQENNNLDCVFLKGKGKNEKKI